jgi:hypothetical protein
LTTNTLYNTKDAYELYVYYLAIKRHFTTSYDFFKYNGKVKVSAMSFENRKDKFHFYKLSKDKEARELILANMLINPNVWIGEMFDDKALRTHQEWKKKKQSLTYQFKSDINELNDDFNSNFVVEDGQHPQIIKLYNMKRISLETLVIVVDIVGCISYWNKNISDKIVWPHINTLVSKYRPFLEYDKVKMKQILVDTYNAKH